MSSSRSWPVGVPNAIERQGYNETPIDTVLRQPTAWGPGLARPRTTFQPYKFTFATQMTNAEYELFLQFFEVTLANGALDFNYQHVLRGWRVFKFDRALYKTRVLANDELLVTLNMMDVRRYVRAV